MQNNRKLFLPSPILKDETEALESLEPSGKKEDKH
jgi:hypothetical protein